MKQGLTGMQYYRAVIAKWIIVNIATRISPLAVLSLSLEIAKLHHDSIEVDDKE